MRVGLIGMSSVGKTTWANKLAGAGFECFHCDDLIADRLESELGQAIATVYDMGDWMGFPYEAQYAEREKIYLDKEFQVLQAIIDDLSQEHNPTRNLVVDMGGSAIYVGEKMFTKLRQLMKVVYLEICPSVQETMLNEYINHPRPLIYQGLFQKRENETNESALARCYSQLISFRENLYEKFCHVKVSYHIHRHPQLTVEEFLTICYPEYF
jgi:shikimate kinase